MASGRWSEADEQALRDGHAAGKTLTAIARELGRSKGHVSEKATLMGLSWDRSQTAAATRSRKAVCAELRTRALERAYNRVHANFDRLEAAEFRTFVKGEYGAQIETVLTWVPVDDEKTLAQAIGTHMATAKRIEDVDSGTLGDLPAVDAWLEAMTSGNAVDSNT